MRTRTRRARGSRYLAGIAAVAVSASFILPSLTPVAPTAEALTSTTITIDGSFGDWVGVRTDSDNVVVDTQIPDDPDYPSQPDRDIYYANATYDDDYLYFAWRRTAGGTKAITWGAYIDLDGDGLLQNTDKVVVYTVSTGNPYQVQGWILHYNQALTDKNDPTSLLYPGGDPMGGDGDTPDGWANWQDGYDEPAYALDAYLSPGNGIEAEARVAWADLGIDPGTPIAIHFASGNGESWGSEGKPSNTWKWIGNPPKYLEENRGQVEDNVGPLYWLVGRSVSINPDNVSGASADTTVTYEHTVTNGGNVDDVFDLSAVSSQGWDVTLTVDGGEVSTVALAADETTTVIVSVRVPSGTADGTQDVTTVEVTSQTAPEVTDSATDTTSVGDVTVTPDHIASMAPGQTITYTHTITNTQPGTDTFDLTASSTLSFPTAVLDAYGGALSAVTLGSGESTTVVVTVSVPSTATVGQQDVTRLLAESQADPAVQAEAEDTTQVRDGLTIGEDSSSFSGAGATVSYLHTIVNSWPGTRTVALSGVSSEGWPIEFYLDDGVTKITTIAVGPNGAPQDVWARLSVPSTASYGDVDTTTVTATSGSYSDTVTDTTTIRQLATYDSGGYVNQEDEYVLGDTVYGRGMGLSPGSKVFFVWKDPSWITKQTSADRTVDTQGMAFDSYSTLQTDEIGIWTLEMYSAGDTPGVDTPLETTDFTVTYDAEITLLTAADAPSVGASTTVDSTVENSNAVAITDSTLTYVIWWDEDGDDVFGAGDVYMDVTGAPVTWDGASVALSHETTGVTVPSGGTWSDPGWSMSNTLFPNQGAYDVTATWTDINGVTIDEKTTSFFSIPTLGWPLFTLAMAGGAWLLWRRRDAFHAHEGGAPA